jgi:hypothetical protein
MTRIVWTNNEKTTIFDEMARIFAEKPGTDRKTAFRLAQVVIPAERRLVITDQRVFSYKEQIQAAHRAGLQRIMKRKEAPEAPAPMLAPTPEPERKESTTERLAGIFEQLLDVLADKVADRLAERIRVEIETRTTTTTEALHRPRHNPLPVSQPRQLRPGVLILGLLPQTGEQMRREFGTRLDIQWYDSDDASKRNVHPMANVVLMTKFINHSIQERWRKAGVLHYCNGGQGELRQILAAL